MLDRNTRLKLQNEATKEFLSLSKHQLKGSEVLVFIPVHNEEFTISKVLEQVKQNCNFDILVVDDGSTDATNSITKQLGVEVLKHPSCLGSMVLLSGLSVGQALNYKYIIKIDGDEQHDAKDIPRLYAQAVETRADMVIGSRHLKKYSGQLWSIQGLGMRFCSKMVSTLSKRKVTDVTSGYLIWNRRAVQTTIQAFNYGLFGDDSTILIEQYLFAVKKGLRIEEINVVMSPRQYGESKSYSKKKLAMFPFNLVRSVFRVLLINK
jgi:glycosyltransferase involved in cell wall biosynthesis